MDQENPTQTSQSHPKTLPVILWIISLALVGFLSYTFGKNNSSSQVSSEPQQNTSNTSPQTAPTAVVNATQGPVQTTPTSTVDINGTCKKSGIAQKWEYLTPYTIKQGDTVSGVAEEQLGDSSRVNEITELNNISYLTVGSTLYLPPKTITKSSGNLKEVYGMLLQKDNAVWHLGFGEGANGNGINIPAYWFSEIPNKNSFQLGDCLTVLFDDGFKVYSVSKQ